MSDGKDDKTRINRVITRSGDDGRTGLADGSRIAKDHPRIQALGALDELNSGLGVLRARALDDDLDALLERVQHLLFDLGGELAVPGTVTLTDDDLVEVESQADMLNAELAPLKEFVLPGGHPDAAWCHHCRTVARRAERLLVTLKTTPDEPVGEATLKYLNRLSDWFFVAARIANDDGKADVLWIPGANR